MRIVQAFLESEKYSDVVDFPCTEQPLRQCRIDIVDGLIRNTHKYTIRFKAKYGVFKIVREAIIQNFYSGYFDCYHLGFA